MGAFIRRLANLLPLLALFITPAQALALEPSPIDSPSIIITGFQAYSTKEYVELYNASLNSIDVDGWKVTYTNSSGGNLKTIATLGGVYAPISHTLFASTDFVTSADLVVKNVPYSPLLYSGMADSGGFVMLYQKVAISADYLDGYKLVQTVGWKSTSSISADQNIVNISGAQSIKRCSDILGGYSVRSDNQKDFYVETMPTLLSKGILCKDYVVESVPVEPPADPVVDPPLPDPTPPTTVPSDIPNPDVPPDSAPPLVVPEVGLSCEGLVLNEALPNATGSDSGKEFIEIYNPTDETIGLKGCALELASGSNDSYVFVDTYSLEPGSYGLFSDIFSGIIMPNSSGATVRLVSVANVELSSLTYPANLEDDQSWAQFGSLFKPTYIPTPGAENIQADYMPCATGYERDALTNRCNKVVVPDVLALCKTGQERNPDTNRCRNVDTGILGTALTPCLSGQERNPDTNRCRNINATLASALTSCPEGQYRNPDTNRCKSVASTNELSACKEGQERNPDTNRCRTVVLGALANAQEVKDVETVATSQGVNLIAGIVIGMTALSYAFYEWRQEIQSGLKKLLSRNKSAI